MSPARRRLLLSLSAVAVLVLGLLLGRAVAGGAAAPTAPVAQDRPGPVLLVPGYGGSTRSLEVLAAVLRADGRQAAVVALPGDGAGDLRESARALGVAADAALAAGAPSVDVVGFSAGGVAARLWVADGGSEQARRVVTLGSPHRGTQLAALGAAVVPGACPIGCQQLLPSSELLTSLNEGDQTPPGPGWTSVWTTQDDVVTPPESARLEGAVDVALQRLCPGLQVTHSQLPTDPVAQAVVRGALSAGPLAPPTPAVCG